MTVVPIQIRLLPLDVDGIYWVQTEPGGESKSVLIWPPSKGWQYNSLQ